MATTMSRLAMTVILLAVSLGQAAAQITSPEPKAQAHKRPIDPLYESVKRPESTSPIDRAVFAKLAELGVEPVLCSDSVFVRARLPRRDRHAPHRRRGPRFLQRIG